jgi:hypothetical protein
MGYFGQTLSFNFYPVYLRGVALFATRQGPPATAEFQKMLEHPGIVLNEMIGPLARLGLGRAYVLSGEREKARNAYQDFLTLWKDANPDIPLLKQARAEYAQLSVGGNSRDKIIPAAAIFLPGRN